MGRVFEAEERLSNRRVALKVLRPELLRDDDGRRMFTSEMQILAQLEHPNIVRSLASLEHEGQPVLVLEYLEGKTLRDALHEGPLPWARAVEIGAQIAAALEAAHGHEPPIVHRDLKPENVMLLTDGTVKVMDFGIAKVLEQAQGKSTHSLGTLQYMSPEQIDAKPVDGRTDLYALGLVLYEALSGEPPFRSASPRELLNLQCTADPPPFGERVEAPAGLKELVFALLAKAPDARPASAETVARALAPLRLDTPRASGLPVQRTERLKPRDAVTPNGTLRSTPTPLLRGDARARRVGSAPREIRATAGVALVAAAALLSGLVTYGARTYYAHARGASADPPTTPSLQEVTEP